VRVSSRVLRIRDPIHGYVTVTAIEQPLLDHPITQRLRWVAQSGLAQFAFPEVRTSRFTHSLGTMHLASRFLLGILRNAEPPVRARLEREFIAAVKDADADVELSKASIGELQLQGLIASTAVSSGAQAATVVVEQALRLAALFHDLGHLPFSHDFEYVIQSLVNEEAKTSTLFGRLGRGKPPHEQIGYAMVSLILRSVYAPLTATELRDVVSPAFKLARQIMAADEPYGLGTAPASIRLLHSLVDGELDVDRSDYLLRDARNYGFEYVTFDLERLVSSLTVHEYAGGDLAVAILPRGQPAAESFLFARYRIYQWGVFQHKVVQLGAALQMISSEQLRGAFSNPMHPMHDFVNEIAYLADPDAEFKARTAALEAFASHDDIWWLGELRANAPASPMRDLVLHRKPGPVSLWKRVSGFPGAKPAVQELNRRLPQRGDIVAEAAWQDLVQRVHANHGVILSRVRFTPIKLDESTGTSLLSVGTNASTARPLSELSPLIAALPATWASDIQVFAFTESNVKDPAAVAAKVCTEMMSSLPSKPSKR
jgi:HD superfamily phosphohydrolase